MGYPKQVYEKAWQILHARKDEARELTAARRTEIRSKIPEVLEIERRMAGTAAMITKSVISSPEKAAELIQRLAAENRELQNRREKLLLNAGYPGDYLSETSFCDKCGDAGYTGAEMCECLALLLRQQAHEHLSAVSPLQNSTFANFRLDFYPHTPEEGSGVVPSERMDEIYNFSVLYADRFTKESESLLFLGQTGLGKTHLSLAIAKSVTENGYGVLYTPTQRLIDRLEAEKFSKTQEDRENYLENINIVLECDLLILDDLGTEFSTSFTSSVLHNIVNTRIVERRPTIISTNLDPQGIEQRYSQRMVSRLFCEYRVFKFFGKDIRFLKKIQGNYNR